ncbi:MAG: beta-propeller domain-containing protein [Clostridia bacterium]|jgi:uncharacterized secreted protein with C-terminal beta-propeller domain|nr:beta-propeller domain-containing protein [Clostridia bacterium]
MKKWPQIAVLGLILVLLAGLFHYAPDALYGSENQMPPGKSAARLQGVIALYIDSPTALVNNQETKLDAGNEFITPLIVANRTIVPVRFIAESLGGRVLWEEKTQTVTIDAGGKTIHLTLNKPEIRIGGETKALDAAPLVYLGRTYVPLRAVSEAFGKKIDYKDGLILIAEDSADGASSWDSALTAQIASRINGLPVLGSADNLKRLLAEVEEQAGLYGSPSLMKRAANATMQQAAIPEAAASAAADTGSAGYSQTNVQVEGVDEGDLVKTDGRYIYQVSGQRVIVSQAYPPESMKVTAVLSTGEADFAPQEIYVDDMNLVVIGRSSSGGIRPMDAAVSSKRIAPPYYYYTPKTKALIYNIRDKQNIIKIREIELDGTYVSSRKIGSALYLVANQYVNYYRGQEEPIVLPAYRDTAVKDETVEIPYSQIHCFPPVTHPNYLLVAGLDLSKPQEAAQISAYLGSGENIYVSEDHLFVAVSQHQYRIMPLAATSSITPVDLSEKTQIFKFSLDNGKVTYAHKGEVPGRILNQFSMDEFQKNFRIATTVGYSWSGGEQASKNNLYVLDSGMGIIGRIENIAPGEQIYSTRFMGERAFMVTFKTVDPLFVLDLSTPTMPRILGALKIPGYSDYLHPYDANHLIGFGKDTVEVAQKDRQGKTVGTSAYYLGMKVALFDVTDVANPRELFVEKIGDRGTDSELLHNHKALLFDKERSLMAFPVTVMEVQGGAQIDSRSNMPAYGQFAFQGAYIYNIDLNKGFALKGRITHLSREDLLKAGYSGADPAKAVQRILRINDTLYTLSDTQIKAHSLGALSEQSSLLLP